MATHSTILASRILRMEEPGRLQSTGSQRVRHNWATSLHLTSEEKFAEMIHKSSVNTIQIISSSSRIFCLRKDPGLCPEAQAPSLTQMARNHVDIRSDLLSIPTRDKIEHILMFMAVKCLTPSILGLAKKFRFLHKILKKNPNELLGQSNTSLIKERCLLNRTHFYSFLNLSSCEL